MPLSFTRRIKAKLLFLSAIGLCLFAADGSSIITRACQQIQSRDITSEDFVRERKSAPRPASSKAKKRRYRLATTQDATTGNVPTRAAIKSSEGSVIEQVGVTIWRLRAAAAADKGPKIEVREEDGTTWWMPERTQVETPFQIGDRVRLSIESPRTGYLYVFNREQYADGTSGEPLLIFPTSQARGGDNRVSPGVLIEIPDRADSPPYFKLTTNRADLVSDMIIVMVTPQPLKEIVVPDRRTAFPTDLVAEWESNWRAQEVQMFEMEGGAGATWTKAEQQAGTFSGRSLTQEEPTPQTIYRLRVKRGDPFLIKVPLRYAR